MDRVAALVGGRAPVAFLGADSGVWARVSAAASEARAFADAREAPRGSFEAVFLCRSVSPTGSAETALRHAGELLTPDGFLAALFDVECDGAPAWCEQGVAVVLSRADLDARTIESCGSCLLAVAGRRAVQPSVFRQLRDERRARAAALNSRGEHLFERGDVLGALKVFADAVKMWDRDAVCLNNLATALFAGGEAERAWDHVFEALHIDPTLASARENLWVLAAHLGRSGEAEHALALFGRDAGPS